MAIYLVLQTGFADLIESFEFVEAVPAPVRHQQPMEAVALAEGVALGTVKSRLHRARAQLVLRMGAALDRVPQKGGGRVAS